MAFCSKCGQENGEKGTFCAGCGQPMGGQPPAPVGGVAAALPPRKVGFLLALGIFFVPIVFSWFTMRKGHSSLSRVLALGWAGLLFLVVVGNHNAPSGDRQVGPAQAAVRAGSTDSAPAQPQARFIGESCDKLARMFGPGSRFSDLQKEELWKSYQRRAFKWQLKVTEVSSDVLGGFTVQYECAFNSPSLIQDVQIKYPDEAKAAVMQLEKGGVYETKGTLEDQSTLFGMSATALL